MAASDAVRAKCTEMCSMFLGPDWNRADLVIEPITSGCSNRIYKCSKDGDHVIVRIYGNDLTGEGNDYKPLCEAAESAIMCYLAWQKMSPNILGLFKGGRIEQFVAGRVLSVDDTRDKAFYRVIAKKMAQIHAITNLPIPVEPNFVYKVVRDYHQKFKDNEHLIAVDDDDKMFQTYLCAFNYDQVLDVMEEIQGKIEFPIVFSHNDMHRLNMLYDESTDIEGEDKKIMIIDFEYCSRNPRFLDIGYFICEMSFASYEKGKDVLPYPEASVRQDFLQSYLDNWKVFAEDEITENDNISNLMLEADYGVLVVHIIRVLWFLSDVRVNHGPMQSWEYTYRRLRAFEERFEEFKRDHASLLPEGGAKPPSGPVGSSSV
ncbi:Choline kinase alpha [Halotydeus destructor]|nr:Choline kinase alpha [Halotydeus destructor]